jgi:hypothetical protein
MLSCFLLGKKAKEKKEPMVFFRRKPRKTSKVVGVRGRNPVPEQFRKRQQYAKLAQAAYAFRTDGEHKVPAGWAVDKDLSAHDYATFVNQTTGKAVIGFRGTYLGKDVKNTVRDLASDAFIALNAVKYSPRFHTSLRVTKKAIAKYGFANVSVTGHSLGGTQAMFINQKTGVEAHVFNPGAGPASIFDSISSTLLQKHLRAEDPAKIFKTDNLFIYQTGYHDVISWAAEVSPGHHQYVKPTNYWHPHEISNFLLREDG